MATIGLLQQRELDRARSVEGQLQRALQTRISIEQAKGVISEQMGIEIDAAFELLRSYARSNNQRLHAVASDVVDGTLAANDLT